MIKKPLKFLFFFFLFLGLFNISQLALATGECKTEEEGQTKPCPDCGIQACECIEEIIEISEDESIIVDTCSWGSCQKKPTAGPCCDDDGKYKLTTATCDSESRTQYRCDPNDQCGNKILQRKQEREKYCPGDSDQCTGSWSSWQTISSSETQCQSWQKCENGDWSEEKHQCKCSGDCLEAPQNPRYYDNPKYPTDPFNPETSKDSTNIYLPVKFDWDDVPGGKDGWIEDDKIKSCTANCVQSYIISFEETTKGSYSTILNKSEYNYLDDPNAGSCFLRSNFTHNWSVQACCAIDGKDCGPEKSDWKFTTNWAPELIEPYDPDWTGEERGEPRWPPQSEENPKPVSFKWCPVEKAQSYYLQAYKNGAPYCPPLFCPIIITKDKKEPIDVLVPEIDFDLDSFTKETNYSWQVATCLSDAGKNCQEYSQLWKFFGLVDLAQVKLISPKNKEFVNFSHSLRWGHVQGAKSYRYRLSGSSPVPAFTLIISLEELWNEGKLKLDTEYFWHVQACWDDKATECQEDGWSEEWKFTTTGKPPENLRTDNTIIPARLDWEDIKGALSYRYEVYEINNSSSQKIVDESIFDLLMTPPSEVLVDYPDLKQEKDYSWRVKTCADKEGEVCGKWSDFQDFTTFKLDTPVNPYPEENGEFFASERYISWDSVLGAKFYQYKINYLFASEEEKSENCLALVGTEIASKIIPASTSKITSAFVSLKCLGEYQWQVQACLDENCQETGDWSGPWNFTLIGVPEKMGLVPCGKNYNNPNTPWDEREPCGIKHIPILFKIILDFLLWRVGLIILVLLVIFTAIIFYISLGAPATIINIKSIWKSAALGYAVVFFAWMIINFFLKIFGITTAWWVFPF